MIYSFRLAVWIFLGIIFLKRLLFNLHNNIFFIGLVGMCLRYVRLFNLFGFTKAGIVFDLHLQTYLSNHLNVHFINILGTLICEGGAQKHKQKLRSLNAWPLETAKYQRCVSRGCQALRHAKVAICD